MKLKAAFSASIYLVPCVLVPLGALVCCCSEQSGRSSGDPVSCPAFSSFHNRKKGWILYFFTRNKRLISYTINNKKIYLNLFLRKLLRVQANEREDSLHWRKLQVVLLGCREHEPENGGGIAGIAGDYAGGASLVCPSSFVQNPGCPFAVGRSVQGA